MTANRKHKISIYIPSENRSITMDIPEGENILHFVESIGEKLPFSCRNGCCTTCAVKIKSGSIDQSKGIGLSHQLQKEGYGLVCIAEVNGPAELETQSEDEVYEKQFGQYLGKIKSQAGNPFDI